MAGSSFLGGGLLALARFHEFLDRGRFRHRLLGGGIGFLRRGHLHQRGECIFLRALLLLQDDERLPSRGIVRLGEEFCELSGIEEQEKGAVGVRIQFIPADFLEGLDCSSSFENIRHTVSRLF